MVFSGKYSVYGAMSNMCRCDMSNPPLVTRQPSILKEALNTAASHKASLCLGSTMSIQFSWYNIPDPNYIYMQQQLLQEAPCPQNLCIG